MCNGTREKRARAAKQIIHIDIDGHVPRRVLLVTLTRRCLPKITLTHNHYTLRVIYESAIIGSSNFWFYFLTHSNGLKPYTIRVNDNRLNIQSENIYIYYTLEKHCTRL